MPHELPSRPPWAASCNPRQEARHSRTSQVSDVPSSSARKTGVRSARSSALSRSGPVQYWNHRGRPYRDDSHSAPRPRLTVRWRWPDETRTRRISRSATTSNSRVERWSSDALAQAPSRLELRRGRARRLPWIRLAGYSLRPARSMPWERSRQNESMPFARSRCVSRPGPEPRSATSAPAGTTAANRSTCSTPRAKSRVFSRNSAATASYVSVVALWRSDTRAA